MALQLDTTLSHYRCPQTGDSLKYIDGSLFSSKSNYPVKNGIPIFLRFDSSESPEEVILLRKLNDKASTIGWQEALKEIYGDQSGMFRYVTDKKRYEWLELLFIDSQTTVLELGSGFGQITSILAGKAKEVWALEVVYEQTVFSNERFRQSDLNNVFIACGGDDCCLPYTSNSFDLVVINMVFEWCASRMTTEPLITGQHRLLSEVIRVLKPGGRLFLSTKNRYALRLLLGGRDEHIFDMRFGSAFPRWLVNLLLSFSTKHRPPGLLHSFWELRRILRGHGFTELRSFWAIPEMRFPAKVIPTDSRSIRDVRKAGVPQGDSRKTKFIMPCIPARLVKYFTAGLTFIAQKPFP